MTYQQKTPTGGTSITQRSSLSFTHLGDTISVFVPIKWRRAAGRKQIILPDPSLNPQETKAPTPLQIALARAYVWQKWLDEGLYVSAKELAKDIGRDPALVGRILRLGLLSPRMVERIMAGDEPEGGLGKLLGQEAPLLWRQG